VAILSGYAGLCLPIRNQHWQSPGRYHKKLPNSPDSDEWCGHTHHANASPLGPAPSVLSTHSCGTAEGSFSHTFLGSMLTCTSREEDEWSCQFDRQPVRCPLGGTSSWGECTPAQPRSRGRLYEQNPCTNEINTMISPCTTKLNKPCHSQLRAF
jgi:hypothetical protein